MEKTANRLINEKSPYLLQHSYNPVDGYLWREEAFTKARAEDKPIFLRIAIVHVIDGMCVIDTNNKLL